MTFLLSFSDGFGNKNYAIAEGELKKDFFRVSYTFDEEEYMLTFTPEVLISVRGGSCPLQISFKKDKTTYAEIGIDGKIGSIPVRTSSFQTAFFSYGCCAVLEYLLDGEARSMKFTAVRKEKAF